MGAPRKNLTVKQMTIAEMLAEGYTQQQAANETGVAPSTISRWQRDDKFVTYRNSLVRSKLHALAGRARKVLEEQLNHKDPWVRQSAANKIIASTGIDRPDTEADKTVRIVWDTDDDKDDV